MHSAHALTPGAGTPSTDAMAADTSSADTRSADTHCPYCALQCGMTVSRAADGRFGVQPRDFPSNKGGLCRKGWTAGELMTAPGRLLTPLLRDRRGGPLRESTWDEALGLVASRIGTIQGTHGRDAMAVFGGGGLTNEKAYLLGKFARVALGTANIDYNGRFCMAAAAAAGIKAFGLDRGLPFPLDDIPGAEAILLTGGNPAETMPPIMQYFEAQRARGGKLIVVDPRLTPTARVAAVHLQLTPGTDAALANGMLHVALQHNLLDRHFIDTRTEGFERVRRIAASYWLDRVERITGVPAKKITEATHLLAEAATAMLLSGRGTEQQSSGTDNVLAFINLFLALGQAGRKHCGYGAMTGQGNGQGGREHGQKADQLPGYRRIDDPAARAAVAGVWGIDPGDAAGPRPVGGGAARPRWERHASAGLFVVASNLAVSAPDATAVIERMGALDLLVVSDMFLSETAALADVVLPITQWAEEDGTMTNLEGRVILRRQVTPPPDGVLDGHARSCPISPHRLGSGLDLSGRPRRGRRRAAPAPAPAVPPTTRASPGRRIERAAAACSGRARLGRSRRHAAPVPRPVRARGRACALPSRAAPRSPPRCPIGTTRSSSPPAGCSRITRPGPRPAACASWRRPSPSRSWNSIPPPRACTGSRRATSCASPRGAAPRSCARG